MEVELIKPFRFPTFDDFLIEKKTLDTLVLHDFDIQSGLKRFFEKYDMEDETHMFDNRIDLEEIQDYSNRHLGVFTAAPPTAASPTAAPATAAPAAPATAADTVVSTETSTETMKFTETKNFIERHIMRINDLKLINFIKVLRKFKNLLDNADFFEAIQKLNKINKQVAAIKNMTTDVIKTAATTLNDKLGKQIQKMIDERKTSDDDATKTDIDAILESIKTEIKEDTDFFSATDNETIDEDPKTWSNAEMKIVESEYFNYSNTVYCFLATKFGYKNPEEECLFFKSKEGGFFDKLIKDVNGGVDKIIEPKNKADEAKQEDDKEEEEEEEKAEEKARLEKEQLIEQIMQSGAKEAEKVFQKIINAAKTKTTIESVREIEFVDKLSEKIGKLYDSIPSLAKYVSSNTDNDEKQKKNEEYIKQETKAAQAERRNDELYANAVNNYTQEQMKNELEEIAVDKIRQCVNKPVLFFDKDKTLLGFLIEVKDNKFSFIKKDTTKKQKDKTNEIDAQELFVLGGKNDNQKIKIMRYCFSVSEDKRTNIKEEMLKIVKDDNSKNKSVFKLNGTAYEPQMNADGTIKTVKQVDDVGSKINEKIKIKLSDDSDVTNLNNCYPSRIKPAFRVNLEKCYYYFDEFTPT